MGSTRTTVSIRGAVACGCRRFSVGDRLWVTAVGRENRGLLDPEFGFEPRTHDLPVVEVGPSSAPIDCRGGQLPPSSCIVPGSAFGDGPYRRLGSGSQGQGARPGAAPRSPRRPRWRAGHPPEASRPGRRQRAFPLFPYRFVPPLSGPIPRPPGTSTTGASPTPGDRSDVQVPRCSDIGGFPPRRPPDPRRLGTERRLLPGAPDPLRRNVRAGRRWPLRGGASRRQTSGEPGIAVPLVLRQRDLGHQPVYDRPPEMIRYHLHSRRATNDWQNVGNPSNQLLHQATNLIDPDEC